jgi:hypothetical protein
MNLPAVPLKRDWVSKLIKILRKHTVRTWRYLYGILWDEGQEAGGESDQFF